MKIKAILLAASVFLVTHAAFATDEIDQVVRAAIELEQPVKDSGLAIAVVKDGRIIFSKGYGYRDRERQLPVTSQTRFAIGSTSKAFTAAALKIAEARGLVDFESPVIGYVPELSFSNPEVTAQANLIDLLAHRTGLPRHDALWYLSGFSRTELVSRMRCLAFQNDGGGKFRDSFVYNNLTVSAAGVVLERVTGETWEDFVQANIFDKIGMPNTGFDAPDFSTDFARPYFANTLLPYKDYSNIGPAASIVSNVEDLALWTLTHLSRGTSPKGIEILDSARMESMYRVYNRVPAEGLDHGLGWFIENLGGKKLLQHGGSADGYHAFVSFMPEAGIGIVAISNQHFTAWPDNVARKVYLHLLGHDPSSFQRVRAANLNEFELTKKRSDAHLYPGISKSQDESKSFENCGYGVMKMAQEGDEKFLSYGSHKWPLIKIPDFGYYFEIEAYGQIFQVPLQYSSGDPGFGLPLEQTAEPVYFKEIQ